MLGCCRWCHWSCCSKSWPRCANVSTHQHQKHVPLLITAEQIRPHGHHWILKSNSAHGTLGLDTAHYGRCRDVVESCWKHIIFLFTTTCSGDKICINRNGFNIHGGLYVQSGLREVCGVGEVNLTKSEFGSKNHTFVYVYISLRGYSNHGEFHIVICIEWYGCFLKKGVEGLWEWWVKKNHGGRVMITKIKTKYW